MANVYCKYLNSRNKEGSAFSIGNFDIGKGLQQAVEQTGLGKQFSKATKSFRKSTGISQERIKSISDLSETNMKLLEENLEKLDTTITIYNYTGIFAATSGVLGSVLLGLKIHRHLTR